MSVPASESQEDFKLAYSLLIASVWDQSSKFHCFAALHLAQVRQISYYSRAACRSPGSHDWTGGHRAAADPILQAHVCLDGLQAGRSISPLPATFPYRFKQTCCRIV